MSDLVVALGLPQGGDQRGVLCEQLAEESRLERQDRLVHVLVETFDLASGIEGSLAEGRSVDPVVGFLEEGHVEHVLLVLVDDDVGELLTEVVVDVSNRFAVLDLLLEDLGRGVDVAVTHRLVEPRGAGKQVGVPVDQGLMKLDLVLVEHRVDGVERGI